MAKLCPEVVMMTNWDRLHGREQAILNNPSKPSSAKPRAKRRASAKKSGRWGHQSPDVDPGQRQRDEARLAAIKARREGG